MRGTSWTSRAKRPVGWIGSRTDGSRTRAAHSGRDVHGPVEEAVAPGPRRHAPGRRRLLPRRRLRLDRARRTAPHRPADRRRHPRQLRVVLARRPVHPDRRGRPAAAPGQPARALRGGGHRADRGGRAARPVHRGRGPGHPGVVLVVAACGFFGLLVAQFRSRVGVPWRRGGTMLFDLRERIRVQSKLPKLPAGLAPGDGAAPGGRPVLLRRLRGRGPHQRRTHPGGRPDRRLRQGHGRRSRALLLSGAFGGLLGSLPRTTSSRPPTAICSARTGRRASPPPSTWSSTWTPATTSSTPPDTRRASSSARAAAAGRRSPPTDPCWACTTAPSSTR